MSRRRLHVIRHQRALLCATAILICGPVTLGQRYEVPKEAVSVRIEPVKSKFHIGEPIQFSIMISNVGSQYFLVPNRISYFGESQANLAVELRNQSGTLISGHGESNDCKDTKPTKLLCELVLHDYVLLRPGTSYTQQVSLYGLYGDLKPGIYHLKASYSADLSFGPCQTLIAEDVDKFPLQAWRGTTALNKIYFTILPNTTKK